MAILKMNDVIGSPWRTPLFNLIHFPITELTMTLDDPGSTKNSIQFIIFPGKPEARKQLMIKGHSIESKVL
jgi:hypothetical protein